MTERRRLITATPDNAMAAWDFRKWRKGVVERVRPKMMTLVAIMADLIPILWSTGTGSLLLGACPVGCRLAVVVASPGYAKRRGCP